MTGIYIYNCYIFFQDCPFLSLIIVLILKSILSDMSILLLSHFSHVGLCATPQTAAHQAPPSMGFSRQEYWSGVPLPSLDMSIATPVFLLFPFSWNIFFHPLNFSLYVPLHEVCLFQKTYTLLLFLCPFSRFMSFGWSTYPFTFKVIIDIYVPIAILFF